MTAQTGPRETSYDVIVIGAGLGGLATGAFLARAGKKVLIVERLDAPGGYAHAFERGPYTFDPAIHWTPQIREGLIWDAMLRALGVEDKSTFLRIETFYDARFPGASFHPASTFEGFVADHIQHFPSEAEGISRFCGLAAQVTAESQQVPLSLSLRELDEAREQFPTLFRYRSATISEVLDECVTDPRAKAVLGASWPYLGLPPSQLSFYTWAAMWTAAVTGDMGYVRGSFQSIVDALVSSFAQSGGELLLNSQVARISVAEGRASGVVLLDGQEITASAVVSNADGRATFEDLLDEAVLPPAFLKRVRRMTPSFSACVLYAATSLDLAQFEPPHETFLFDHWDHDVTYQDILNGKPGGIWVNVPTLVDPSLAPTGEHLLIMTSMAEYGEGTSWEERKEPVTDALLEKLNGLFPGVRDHLTYTEFATPLTLWRYSLNQGGACYGWANTPKQATTGRLSNVTPVENLFLAGHWTQPGSGSLRSAYSGLITASVVLGYPTIQHLLDALIGSGGPARA